MAKIHGHKPLPPENNQPEKPSSLDIKPSSSQTPPTSVQKTKVGIQRKDSHHSLDTISSAETVSSSESTSSSTLQPVFSEQEILDSGVVDHLSPEEKKKFFTYLQKTGSLQAELKKSSEEPLLLTDDRKVGIISTYVDFVLLSQEEQEAFLSEPSSPVSSEGSPISSETSSVSDYSLESKASSTGSEKPLLSRSSSDELSAAQKSLRKQKISHRLTHIELGTKAEKYYSREYEHLYKFSGIKVDRHQREKHIEALGAHLLKEAEKICDEDHILHNVLDIIDMKLVFCPDHEKGVEFKDKLGFTIKITPSPKGKFYWQATLISPDGKSTTFTTKIKGEEGFEKIVKKIEKERLSEIAKLVELQKSQGKSENVPVHLKSHSTNLEKLTTYIRKHTELLEESLHPVSVLTEGVAEGVSSVSHLSGGVFGWITAGLELKKASRNWKSYKDKIHHAETLRASGQEKEAEQLEDHAYKIRKEVIGTTLTSINTIVCNALETSHTAIELSHVIPILATASMALGIGSGALIMLTGVYKTSLDANKILHQIKPKKMLADMSNTAKEILNNNPDPVMQKKALLLQDFAVVQKRYINSEITLNSLRLGGADLPMVAGGAVMIAAAATSVPTLGITAGVLLGTAAAVTLGVAVASYAHQKIEAKHQRQLEQMTPHLSMKGILARISTAIEEEKNSDDKTITHTIVESFMKMPPEIFNSLTEPIIKDFKLIITL